MKTVITIILVVVAMLFIANTTIEIKPFKISFERPYVAIGFLFLFLGLALIQFQSDRDGYKRGLIKGAEITHEAATQAAKEIIEESKTKQQ